MNQPTNAPEHQQSAADKEGPIVARDLRLQASTIALPQQRILEAPVRAEIVLDGSGVAELSDFECGSLAETADERTAAGEVRQLALSAYNGELSGERIAVLRTGADELIGFAAIRMQGDDDDAALYRARSLAGPCLAYAPYIHAIGRRDEFAGCRLSDASTSTGTALVRMIYDVVTLEADGRPAPAIGAKVLPGNRRSHSALGAGGYELWGRDSTGRERNDIRWRPGTVPDGGLPAFVYTPPSSLPWGPKSWTVAREPGAAVAVGRNDRCPCGSGRKFKKCCGF